MHRSGARTLVAAGAVLGLLLAGCGGDDDSTPTTTTPEATSPSSTTAPPSGEVPSSSDPPSSVPEDGCPGEAAPPEGAATQEVESVDGDLAPDTLWLAREQSTVTIGIRTAAGGGATHTLSQAANPQPVSALFADVDVNGLYEVLVSDGIEVQLLQFDDCDLFPIMDEEGQPYTFALGHTEGAAGTGVGCDEFSLLGLDAPDGTDGDTVRWTSTVVALHEGVARNLETTEGTFQRPEDDEAIEMLTQVTCGHLTMADDGLTLPS